MHSSFILFGKEIPVYGIMFYLGIALAATAAVLLLRSRKNIPAYDLVYSAVYAMIGAVIGSKLLFILVSLEDIIELSLPLYTYIKGGFVFYGGFIGGVLGLFIYAKQFKMQFADFVDIYAAVLPLGHGVGRIGCYFAGCCYGLPYDGFGAVVYRDVPGNTPLGVTLFPIQLLEATALILLFVLLAFIYVRSHRLGTVANVYIGVYAVLRFVLEFFRGDKVRGVFFSLSTSQWISIALLAILIISLIFKQKEKPS